MHHKTFLSRLLALLLVVAIGLIGCSSDSSPNALSGNYTEDTLSVLSNLKTAIGSSSDAPEQVQAYNVAKQQINDYASRYRRNDKVSGLRSFTTMQTALNSIAGFYTSYGNRPLPEKLKKRLTLEFAQVESAVKRGS
jgi:photosystem II Psb27 protein